MAAKKTENVFVEKTCAGCRKKLLLPETFSGAGRAFNPELLAGTQHR